MLFADIRSTLVTVLRERVRNGELTERGLARLVGVSQPHIHNVLKGARELSIELSDQILQTLRISLLDLIERDRLQIHLNSSSSFATYVYVPVLKGYLGPSQSWPTEVSEGDRLPFRTEFVRSISNAVAARLAADPRMSRVFTAGDLALLDQSQSARSVIESGAYYVVKVGNSGMVRRLQAGHNCIYLISDDTQDRASGWQCIPTEGRSLTHFVRARAHLVSALFEWQPR